MEREYVIVCLRHKGLLRDALLFWGEHTEDNEKRSFGGYTIDVTKCEKYTLEEVQERKFKVQGIDFEGRIPRNMDDCAIKVSELLKMGYRQFTVIA